MQQPSPAVASPGGQFIAAPQHTKDEEAVLPRERKEDAQYEAPVAPAADTSTGLHLRGDQADDNAEVTIKLHD